MPKPTSPPTPATPPQPTDHSSTVEPADPFSAVEAACAEAGLQVMAQVLSIVAEREEVPMETLAALTPEEIYDLYEGWIGPAVDKVENSLLGHYN